METIFRMIVWFTKAQAFDNVALYISESLYIKPPQKDLNTKSAKHKV